MQSSQKIKLIYENDIAYNGFELETKIDNNLLLGYLKHTEP